MGARPYRSLTFYQPEPGSLIEIGSERGEGSTAWLAAYAQRHGLTFLTADIDPAVHRDAREITDGARLSTGSDLLARARGPVSVLYMDGFDWIPPNCDGEQWIREQRARYERLGVDMNNRDCQRTHLDEAQAAAPKLAGRCVAVCDDTWKTSDGWDGKAGLAVPFLLNEGFQVIDEAGCEPQSLGFVVLAR